jgi:hypothetical protein
MALGEAGFAGEAHGAPESVFLEFLNPEAL